MLERTEETSEHPRTPDHAHQLLTKLQSLDEDFKRHHFELTDIVDGDDNLEKEQTVLNKHDNDVTSLLVRLQTLLTPKVKDPLPKEKLAGVVYQIACQCGN